jgi:multicomponent Na+:H+ antiporter subunit D
MVSSLLNIAYLLPVSLRGFFGRAGAEDTDIQEAPVNCQIAMAITSVACLMLFLFPEAWYRLVSLVLS